MERKTWLQSVCILPDDEPCPPCRRSWRGGGQYVQIDEAGCRAADKVCEQDNEEERHSVGKPLQIEPDQYQ